MAKKGGNSKAEAAKDKKAAVKAEKDRAKQQEMEAKEADKWAQGAKGKNKKEAEAEKKAAALAKKQEAARQLAEEEKELSKFKPTAKGSDKKAAKKSAKVEADSHARRTIPEFSASNIDDAIDLLSLNDDGSGPVKAKDIEKHPERRFKAALAAYEEREMPRFKQEHPGLRQSQLKEIIYKAFQKSPENPFNQQNIVQYNATSEDAKNLKERRRKELEDRLRA
ncbi:uncharacterized protein BYT42DRAFT_605200 [Radiomyces spectabilis]|uniref:uncharacterized protein n=1 Tax=Radiomyces spectabilis TaxID=64574 RepID=UPI00221E7CBA|nr:uncharacterized protein BYT42DRAFT_605200 [Radiomyces spectabilis]KAI8377535.1 hypothetical protein BYT42DRAFT_605200 [Radiomyces spectabilis]